MTLNEKNIFSSLSAGAANGVCQTFSFHLYQTVLSLPAKKEEKTLKNSLHT